MAAKKPSPTSERLSTQTEAQKEGLKKLDFLLARAEETQWEVADQLVRLIDGEGMTLAEIAKRYIVNGKPQDGRSKPRLSQYYSTAIAFPPGKRDPNRTFYAHEVLRASTERVKKSAKRMGFPNYKPKTSNVMNSARMSNGRKNPRQVTRTLAGQAHEDLMPFRFAAAQQALKDIPSSLVNQAHFGDYENILAKMPENSIKLLHADVPYAQYEKIDSGAYCMGSSSATFTACANDTQAEALETTTKLFRLARKAMRDDGVIALWQSGHFLRPEIPLAAMKEGFNCWLSLTWLKVPQPGDHDSAFSPSTETCYLFRKGETLLPNLCLDHPVYGSRKTYWDFQPVRHNAANIKVMTHAFQKPHEWNELLLLKFTTEGDLVFDAFGCSGSMCIAAHQLKRNWVYCELEKTNFEFGYTLMKEAGLFEAEHSQVA